MADPGYDRGRSQVLADYGYEGWLTIEAEQDHRKAHPLTYAIKARAYLREITGL